MALLFTEIVFDKFITDTASYADQPVWGLLGTADKLLLEFVGTNVSGAQPLVDVVLQDSNDGVNWNDKSTLISGGNFSTTAVQFASDDGSTPSGRFVRLKLNFQSSGNSGQLKVIATGRSV